MNNAEYDLVVIGGGSGGVRAARLAAMSGAKVVLVEARELGGTCVHRGCVPKKLLMYASRFTHDFVDAPSYGWEFAAKPELNWSTLRDNVRTEVARLDGIYEKNLVKANVEILRGFGRLVGPAEVEVSLSDGGSCVLKAKRILLAVGGKPRKAAIPGAEHYKLSDDLFTLPQLPNSAVVVGGGYIGLEFASILRLLGVETRLVHRGDALLRDFDSEAAEHLRGELEKAGIELHLGRSVVALEERNDGVVAVLDDDTELTADLHIAAIGRVPNTDRLGLDAAGVLLDDKGGIIADANYRTNVPHIFALGDVIRRVELTPVAIAEAIAFAHAEFGVKTVAPAQVDYARIPTSVFTTPELATVGVSEEQMIASQRRARIYTTSFRTLKQSLSGREGRSFFKLIVEDETNEVVGAHLIGEGAAEILQFLAVCVAGGVTKDVLDATISIHPSSAEELVQMRTPTRVV